MATMVAQSHHHRSTTKTEHKPFKSKHATKSALKDRAKGKVERDDIGKRRTPHQQVMSKLERRNKSKQLRISHKEKQDLESTIFQGVDGAAKHIAVVPLADHIDVYSTIEILTKSVDVGLAKEDVIMRTRVDRFKRNLAFLPCSGDLLETLDTCKLADWVVFLLTSDQQFGPDEDMLLRAVEGQGITSVAAIVVDLEQKASAGKRSKQLTDLKSEFGRYFADLDKIYSADSKSDCSNLVRTFCTASAKGIKWRDDRTWMLVDNVKWTNAAEGSETVPVISGTVRGKSLNPDRLVYVQGWGEYKIKKITQVPPQVHKRKANEMAVEEWAKEWAPSEQQDDLAELAPDEANMVDATSTTTGTEHKGVLLDDHHYFSDDNSHIPAPPKKLPKGTSSYQAAWYLEDISDSDSDITDGDEAGDVEVAMDDLNLGPEDGVVADRADAMTDAGGTEYPETEMHVDIDAEEEAKQLAAYRARRKKEAEDDLEFPDEIELHPDVLARERLAKYRGLKSLRTSEWNTEEDKAYEPLDYQRLLQIPDYKKSYSAAIKESLVGPIPAGTKVEIELEDVPTAFSSRSAPRSLFSLLHHEHKYTVVNLNLTLDSYLEDPVKSKEELIVQIGHRRFAINPVFSAAGTTPNNVHKFDRYLHPGRTAIATFTGPLTWGSVPCLVFRQYASPENTENDDTNAAPTLIDSSASTTATPSARLLSSSLTLVGTATTLPPSNTRVIAKRIILTGIPFKIHKKLVTIRYMFFNRADVLWFSALPLFTKRGRQGYIKEPLGTHGYFKALFDSGSGKVNSMDAVGVSLYKRVWPRPCRRVE